MFTLEVPVVATEFDRTDAEWTRLGQRDEVEHLWHVVSRQRLQLDWFDRIQLLAANDHLAPHPPCLHGPTVGQDRRGISTEQNAPGRLRHPYQRCQVVPGVLVVLVDGGKRRDVAVVSPGSSECLGVALVV
ncbi:MAG: hypothetical protein ABSG39_04045 [Acidimicrobiales bacterium]